MPLSPMRTSVRYGAVSGAHNQQPINPPGNTPAGFCWGKASELMPAYLIGVDIGTSSTKSLLVTPDGHILATAAQEYPIHSPQPGWAEQDPQDWVDAVVATLRNVLHDSGVNPAQVAGLSLAGQMHTLTPLDESGAPVRRAILWADRRSVDQVTWLRQRLADRLGPWTGNPLATGFMLPSWVWLLQHEPAAAARTRWLLLPKDYVRLRLTGQVGTEASDASSTLLFDPHTRAWSTPLLNELEIDARLLPPLGGSLSVAGALLPEMAYLTGLPTGLPVIFGGSDQAMQALGQGILEPGVVSCTIGTGGQVFAPLHHPVHDPQLRLHLFCHAAPDRWHLQGAILSAGLALRWLRDNILNPENYAALADSAAEAAAASQGLFFLPHLAGERTPHMDPLVRAAFIGLDLRHTRANLTRAVMEGVVFALRQTLDLVLELGAPLETLVAAGGSTRHPLWLQLQADIFNRAVHPSASADSTAVGAALLAGVGAGVFADLGEAVRRAVTPLRPPVQPDPARAGMYSRAYERYRQLYPAIKEWSSTTD